MKDKILLSSSDFNEDFSSLKNITFFELELEKYLKSDKKAVALNSGTSAIHLALILAGVVKNDIVFCQTATFSASAFPILYQGAEPVFIDSEEDTWNMCPVVLEEAIRNMLAIGKKPKAIIIVHLYGMPAKMDAIVAIAKKNNIILIEDAAEALGSSFKKKKCGTFGEFGVLSFNENKIITTSGGGALVCVSENEKQKAVFLATQARDIAPHYQHTSIGYNYRMSSVLADIGKKQIDILDTNVALRRKNNQFYQKLFKNIDGIMILIEPCTNYYSNHWLTCILINDKITGFTREDLRLQLKVDNIESRPLWKPMHLQPVFKDCLYFGETVAENLFENGLCLPSGSNLTDDDRKRIKQSIKKLLRTCS